MKRSIDKTNMKEMEKSIANLMDWCYKITCMAIGKSQTIDKTDKSVQKYKKNLELMKRN